MVVERDDRVEPTTRLLCAVIVPFPVVAATIHLLRPTETARLIAWPVVPPLTAMLLGSAYLGGAFLLRPGAVGAGVAPHRPRLPAGPRLRRHAGRGHGAALEPVHPRAPVVRHLDGADFTTPFLVAAAWGAHRRRDPGVGYEPLVPEVAARILVGVGAAATALSLLLFAFPAALAEVWPWEITALTGRVLASLFVLLGLAALGVGSDRRWSAARLLTQTALVMLTAVAVSLVVRWEEVDSGPATWFLAARSVSSSPDGVRSTPDGEGGGLNLPRGRGGVVTVER